MASPVISYSTLSDLDKETRRLFIAKRDDFCIFIDPVSDSRNNPDKAQTSRFAYIPYYGKNHSTVFLEHNTIYKIGILNHSSRPANCQIVIDDQLMGVFQVPKYSSDFRLEHPLNCYQAFTFISSTSDIAQQSGISASPKPGTSIKVYILPEDPTYNYKTNRASLGFLGMPCETVFSSPSKSQDTLDSAKSPKSQDTTDKGLTVLGRMSNQVFTKAPYIATRGEFIFKLNLALGDPSKNSLYCVDLPRLK